MCFRRWSAIRNWCNDVNVAFRVLKNHIREETGISAYAAYTQAAVDALGIHEFVDEMQVHLEEFPDVGEIKLYVEDLDPIWQRESKRRRVFVDPEDAFFVAEMEIPAQPPLVWDFFTSPQYRTILNGYESTEIEGLKSGRVGVGSSFVCAHGEEKVVDLIVDWRPFEYYTYQTQMGNGLLGTLTVRLIPTESGTRIIGIVGQFQGPVIARTLARLARGKIVKEVEQGAEDFRDLVLQELESGKAVRPEASSVPEDQVTAAAQASLAEVGAD